MSTQSDLRAKPSKTTTITQNNSMNMQRAISHLELNEFSNRVYRMFTIDCSYSLHSLKSRRTMRHRSYWRVVSCSSSASSRRAVSASARDTATAHCSIALATHVCSSSRMMTTTMTMMTTTTTTCWRDETVLRRLALRRRGATAHA